MAISVDEFPTRPTRIISQPDFTSRVIQIVGKWMLDPSENQYFGNTLLPGRSAAVVGKFLEFLRKYRNGTIIFPEDDQETILQRLESTIKFNTESLIAILIEIKNFILSEYVQSQLKSQVNNFNFFDTYTILLRELNELITLLQ